MNPDELKEKIIRLSQFPHKERKQPYQSYYMRDEGYQPGSRDTLYRYDKMCIGDRLHGISVLDLGSQLAAMSIEASRRGARPILGIEFEKDFIDCSRELIKYNNMDITIVQQNLIDVAGTLRNIRQFFGQNIINIVYALALTKHIKVQILFSILRGFQWDTCYVEGHNCNGDLNTPHCQDTYNNLIKHYKHTFLGFVEDRSIRPVWRLERIKRG